MATAPPLSLENQTPNQNDMPRRIESPRNVILPQSSTETNNSDDIKPTLQKDKEIFTVDNHISKMNVLISQVLPAEENLPKNGEMQDRNGVHVQNGLQVQNAVQNGDLHNGMLRGELPSIMRSRRNILEPLKREDAPVPLWSLAKGPCVVGMLKKCSVNEEGKL